MQKAVLCLLSVTFLLSGCFKKENDCAPKNIVASSGEIKTLNDYLTSQSISATPHSSGLFYKMIQDGNGTAPTLCSDVRVNFSGRLPNGTEFEKNTDVILNVKITLESWRIMLPMMKPGARYILYVPPTLGYGSEGKKDKGTNTVVVEPNAPVLIYDITLLEVK